MLSYDGPPNFGNLLQNLPVKRAYICRVLYIVPFYKNEFNRREFFFEHRLCGMISSNGYLVPIFLQALDDGDAAGCMA